VSTYLCLGCCWSDFGIAAIIGEVNRLLSLDLSSLENSTVSYQEGLAIIQWCSTVNSVRSEVKTGDISPGVEGTS
jgi:hypothetical protein